MRKTYILLGLLVIAAAAWADNDQTENGDGTNTGFSQSTLFGNRDFDIGGYGGPILQGSYNNGNFYCTGGAEGGVILNHWLIIGASGKGYSMNSQSYYMNPQSYSTNWTNLSVGWGGIMIGFVIMPESVVHPYITATIGGGEVVEVPVSYSTNNNDKSRPNWRTQQSPFFSLEGEVGVEVNVTRWMRVALYGGYHYIYGPVYITGISDSDLMSYDVGLKCEFGRF